MVTGKGNNIGDLSFKGTLSGTISGTKLTFTMNVKAVGFNCSVELSGSADVSERKSRGHTQAIHVRRTSQTDSSLCIEPHPDRAPSASRARSSSNRELASRLQRSFGAIGGSAHLDGVMPLKGQLWGNQTAEIGLNEEAALSRFRLCEAEPSRSVSGVGCGRNEQVPSSNLGAPTTKTRWKRGFFVARCCPARRQTGAVWGKTLWKPDARAVVMLPTGLALIRACQCADHRDALHHP